MFIGLVGELERGELTWMHWRKNGWVIELSWIDLSWIESHEWVTEWTDKMKWNETKWNEMEWVSEWMTEWMKGIKGGIKGGMSVRMNEYMKGMNEWMNERMNESANEWMKRMNDWVSEWIKKRVWRIGAQFLWVCVVYIHCMLFSKEFLCLMLFTLCLLHSY